MTARERLRSIVREKERACVVALLDALQLEPLSDVSRAMVDELRAYYDDERAAVTPQSADAPPTSGKGFP